MKHHTAFKTGIFVLLHTSLALVAFGHSAWADETALATSSEISPVSIQLEIETASSTLFDGTISVVACAPDASSTPTTNGYCALEQTGLPVSWSDYGEDKFLSSIQDVANDFSRNQYWGWFSNLEYGETALNQHIVHPDEHLLVTIGKMPLKLLISSSSPSVYSTTTLSVFQFGFDESWNPAWLPAASSTITVGDSLAYVPASGTYDMYVSSPEAIVVSAAKDGFIKTATTTINPVQSSTSSTSEAPPRDVSSLGGGTGGTLTNPSHCDANIPRAIQFLLSRQKPDGSFGSSLYTDWAAIAVASAIQGSHRDALIAYLGSNSTLLSPTDFERHAMALMSLGINPYSGTSADLIQRIVGSFDGTQIGDRSLVNDDIFALFPLMKAGYTVHDPLVQKIIAFILSNQESDGSWQESVDLTAAAVQALVTVNSVGGVPNALSEARTYLRVHQQNDGGFGSSFSTSWALQAISALGESYRNWSKNGSDPETDLCLLQQDDGGFESTTTNDTTRLWATAYAVTAIESGAWSSFLPSFTRPVSPSVTAASVLPAPLPVSIASSTRQVLSTTTISSSVQPIIVAETHPFVRTASAKTVIGSSTEKQESGTSSTVSAVDTIHQYQVAAVGESGFRVEKWSAVILGSFIGIGIILFILSIFK